MTKNNCTYKIAKYFLIIIVVLAICGSLLFNINNELKCSGEWDNNKISNNNSIIRNGKGYCKWTVGLDFLFTREPIFSWEAKYEGEWKNNKKEGLGIFRSMSGCKYEGEWKEDQRDGKGTFIFSDNSSITGNWFRGNLTCSNGEIKLSSHKIQEISGARYTGHLIDGLMHGSGQIFISNFQLICFFSEGLLNCNKGKLYEIPSQSADNDLNNNIGKREFSIQFWKNQFHLFNYQSDVEIFSKYSDVTYKLEGNEDATFIPYFEGKIVDLNFPVDHKMIQEELALFIAMRDYIQNFEINFLSKYYQMKSAIYDFGNSEKEEALKKEKYLQREKEKENEKEQGKDNIINDDSQEEKFFESENPFELAINELKNKHQHGEL